MDVLPLTFGMAREFYSHSIVIVGNCNTVYSDLPDISVYIYICIYIHICCIHIAFIFCFIVSIKS